MSNDNSRSFTGVRYDVASNGEDTNAIDPKHSYKSRPRYKKTKIILIILAVIVIIGIIVLCHSFYTYKTREQTSERPICMSDKCLKSAANLKLSMDLSVDPCDDFYTYTCGKWDNEHIDHKWYYQYSQYETIEERIAVNALKFLKTNAAKNEPLPVRQSRDLYKSCMDEETLDELGYSVILKYLKLVDLPEVPRYLTVAKGKRNKLDFDWINVDVKAKKMLARDLFLEFYVSTNVFNGTNNIMYLGSARRLSPLPSPSRPKRQHSGLRNRRRKAKKYEEKAVENTEMEKEPEEEEEVESNSKVVIRYIMEAVLAETAESIDDAVLNEAIDIIDEVTKALSSLASEEQDFFEGNNDFRFDYKNISIYKLQNVTENTLLKKINYPPKKYLWERYFQLLFEDVKNVTLDIKKDRVYFLDSELVNVFYIIQYLAITPGLHLELYAWYQTVYAMIKSTTTEMSNYVSEDYDYPRTRSIYCAEVVVDYMGMAVSYGITDQSFINSTKPKVEEMVHNIKEAFIEKIKKNTWMDEETKKAVMEKNKQMFGYVGVPEWLWNNTVMEEYYEGIVIKNDTYLENLLSIVRKYTSDELSSLREVNPTRGEWTDPTVVNAYHDLSNVIMIPFAILSFPFYHLGLEVLNYGATGSTVGHELMHGFDRSGRDFDQHGNYKQYWSNKSIEAFNSKTECFISQYENFTIPNVNATLNGTQTLDENIADNEGLVYTYFAYKKYQAEYGSEFQLPGFTNYTDEQLFFLSYGSTWCLLPQSDEDLENILRYGRHSPFNIRLLGSLQNFEEFAKAFQCPLGSKMNPNRSRCNIY